MNWLFVDIGHTAIKVAKHDGRQLANGTLLFEGDKRAERLCGYLDEQKESYDSVLLCAVDKTVDWSDYLSAGCRLTTVKVSDMLPTQYNNPATLGVDRWCAMLGAISLGYTEAIVVDFGSATTIDILSAKRHVGGLIYPGLTLSSDSLGIKTTLPKKQNYINEDSLHLKSPIGTTTESCIANGLMLSQLAPVQFIAKNTPGNLVVTGGIFTQYQSFIKTVLEDRLDMRVHYYPDLIFLGMAYYLVLLKG